MTLVGDPVRRHIDQAGGDGLWVSEIDPNLADTAAFCEHYDIGLDISANCVVVEAKRADRVWHAACMVLATTRADVNGIVRKHLDARKISFASMDTAVSLTGMEYGGITPVGLPADWPILVDRDVVDQQQVIIGSGVRGSKLLVSTDVLVGTARRRGAQHHQGRLASRQHQGCLVVGMEAVQEPGGRHQWRGFVLTGHPGVGDRHGLTVLVNGCRAAGQNVLDPMGFESVADEDDVAVVGVENVQRCSVRLSGLSSACSSVPWVGAHWPNASASGLVM